MEKLPVELQFRCVAKGRALSIDGCYGICPRAKSMHQMLVDHGPGRVSVWVEIAITCGEIYVHWL